MPLRNVQVGQSDVIQIKGFATSIKLERRTFLTGILLHKMAFFFVSVPDFAPFFPPAMVKKFSGNLFLLIYDSPAKSGLVESPKKINSKM